MGIILFAEFDVDIYKGPILTNYCLKLMKMIAFYAEVQKMHKIDDVRKY